MTRQTGINAPLYKIDTDTVRNYFADEINAQDIPARLVEEYNKRKKDIVYESKGKETINGSYVEAFLNIKSTPNTSSWVRFFKDIPTIEFGTLSNQFQHLICFVVLGDDLYAFTAGQSAVVFERFIDLSFPIEVGRRIAKPEVKSAHTNQITGSTLASDLHFRDPRRITYAESLDTVWTALSGYIRSNKLALKAVTDVFGVKDKIKIDVSSSLRLGPKVQEPSKLINLIKWLAEQEQEALPEDDGWAPLDAIKLLNPRKKRILIERLHESLAEKIFKNEDYTNLAITHADISLYASATRYVIVRHDDVLLESTVEPQLEDTLRNTYIDEAYVNNFTAITIRAINEDYGPSHSTEGTLLAHLNGELTYRGKTYFLLTGKWYEVDATYIEQIKKDFINLLNPLDIPARDIGMRPWRTDESEGAYNVSSLAYDECINGDSILTDNVELFDTLAYRGNELYVLHVKRDFNVKIRDVRSQLLASALVIENDLRSSSNSLKNHHRQLVEKGRTALSQGAFLELFSRPRVYVLCYGTEDKVTAGTIGKFRSSVAKMEVVSLNNQFRQISTDDSARLRIAWIQVTD